MRAYGVASKYGFVLPYSRKHESEADHVGLLFMAEAGYDPREAPRFWERFAQYKGGEAQAEFLSTHPSDERRSAELRELLAEAVPIYDESATKYGIGEMISMTSKPLTEPRKSGPDGTAGPDQFSAAGPHDDSPRQPRTELSQQALTQLPPLR